MTERLRERVGALPVWQRPSALEPTPGARVLSALVVTAAIATLPSVTGWVALGVLACALGAACVAKPNIKRLSVRLGAALGMVLALLLPFLLVGDFERVTKLGLRALGAATVALAFTSRLSGTELAHALGALRAPVALVEVIEGLASQLDTLKSTAKRILLARRLRGAHGIAGSISVLPELLVRSAERAERQGLARRLRGFDHAQLKSKFQRQDVVPLLIAAISAALLHALAW
jgi:energy-coupling factor transporter transmembrane protein EcfT